MYTLISEYGNVRCVTAKESKRDELLRLGYRLVEDERENEQESEVDPEPKPEKGESKRRKRTSQSTAEE